MGVFGWQGVSIFKSRHMPFDRDIFQKGEIALKFSGKSRTRPVSSGPPAPTLLGLTPKKSSFIPEKNKSGYTGGHGDGGKLGSKQKGPPHQNLASKMDSVHILRRSFALFLATPTTRAKLLGKTMVTPILPRRLTLPNGEFLRQPIT
ncbi:MAG: hypothetical protein CM15mP46_7580 [Alphaproteobacteria bacterium]|nr:MAG: hypothetical protein CM15mP46_7580 [Alphaproteobacteria bacterium]